MGKTTSLLFKIIAFHVVYLTYQKEVMWFGQLTTCLPGILVQLNNALGRYNT